MCAVKGYHFVLTMPESMSIEIARLLKAMGAELVLTPRAAGMTRAVERARAIHAERPGSLLLQQFDNPANPQVHYDTTALQVAGELGPGRKVVAIAPDFGSGT